MQRVQPTSHPHFYTNVSDVRVEARFSNGATAPLQETAPERREPAPTHREASGDTSTPSTRTSTTERCGTPAAALADSGRARATIHPPSSPLQTGARPNLAPSSRSMTTVHS